MLPQIVNLFIGTQIVYNYCMPKMNEVNKERRLRELENLFNELRNIETYYLPSLFKETQKGIDNVNRNEEYFFPSKGYMQEKIDGMKSSIDYIERMLYSK